MTHTIRCIFHLYIFLRQYSTACIQYINVYNVHTTQYLFDSSFSILTGDCHNKVLAPIKQTFYRL